MTPTAASAPTFAPQAAHPHQHPPSTPLLALQSLLSLVVIAIFIITFTAQPFRIPSGSMEPTLLIGDFLLVDKQSTSPGASAGLFPSSGIHRGDVIVFHDPVDDTLHLVKRVVGLPGDRLRLRGGRVFVNGQPLNEPYAVYRPGPPDNFRDNFPRLQSPDPEINSGWWIRMRRLIDDGELIIPAGDYFVLGDNRNDSEDSRYWGFVPRNAIVGKPLLIYFSLHQPDPEALAPSALVGSRQSASRLDAVASLARWNRIFQVVR